jgi:hypothetical protein
MKKIVLLIIATMSGISMFAQIYMAKTCEISFLSVTPVENIAAVNKATKPLLNITTGDLQMKIVMTAFVFEKPLMQEHFNENYLESEKFPNAFFKGKINEKVDYTKDGEYKVTATGKLTIHGVEKDKTIEGVLTVKGQEITLKSTFKVVFADYAIVIPALQSTVIPPDTEVKLNATLEPFKKN